MKNQYRTISIAIPTLIDRDRTKVTKVTKLMSSSLARNCVLYYKSLITGKTPGIKVRFRIVRSELEVKNQYRTYTISIAIPTLIDRDPSRTMSSSLATSREILKLCITKDLITGKNLGIKIRFRIFRF